MATSAKPAAKAETVTLRHLAMALAESHDVPKKQAVALLRYGRHHHQASLKGARIRMSGLGILPQASGAHGPTGHR
jgi:DNA-binding protein HU-beta